jgi:hypothetical protein
LCVSTCAEGFDFFFFPQPVEQMANHIQAHAGTFLLQIGDAEFAWLPLDCVKHECGLRSARAFDVASALFEFSASAADDGEKEIQPRSQIVFALVPAGAIKSKVEQPLERACVGRGDQAQRVCLADAMEFRMAFLLFSVAPSDLRPLLTNSVVK